MPTLAYKVSSTAVNETPGYFISKNMGIVSTHFLRTIVATLIDVRFVFGFLERAFGRNVSETSPVRGG